MIMVIIMILLINNLNLTLVFIFTEKFKNLKFMLNKKKKTLNKIKKIKVY